jgi:hypothetical protein
MNITTSVHYLSNLEIFISMNSYPSHIRELFLFPLEMYVRAKALRTSVDSFSYGGQQRRPGAPKSQENFVFLKDEKL